MEKLKSKVVRHRPSRQELTIEGDLAWDEVGKAHYIRLLNALYRPEGLVFEGCKRRYSAMLRSLQTSESGAGIHYKATLTGVKECPTK